MASVKMSTSGSTSVIKITADVTEHDTWGSSRDVTLNIYVQRVDFTGGTDIRYTVSGGISDSGSVATYGSPVEICSERMTVNVSSSGSASISSITVNANCSTGSGNKSASATITGFNLTTDDDDDDDDGGDSGGSSGSTFYSVYLNNGGYTWDYFPSNNELRKYKNTPLDLPQPYRNSTNDNQSFIITGIANGGNNNTTLSATKNIITSYTFNGWRDTTDGTIWQVQYNHNSGTTLTATQTSSQSTTYNNNTLSLLSKPTRSSGSETFTVIYNGNGGTVNRYSDNATRTVNYNFAYWCSNSTGDGTRYTDSTSFNDSTSVYAIWNISSDNTTTINLPTATREGYNFLGWGESVSSEYCITDSYTPTSNITLYAQWVAKDDIVYTINHHIKDVGTNTYSLHLSENRVANADSVLTLSNLITNIDGFVYKEGKVNGSIVSTVTVKSDGSLVINLYYTRNTYTVSLIKTSDIQSVNGAGVYEHGASVTIEAIFDNDVYYFSKWSGDFIITDNTNPTTFIMPTQNVSLIPEVEYNLYTITYDGNDGNNIPSSGTKRYGFSYQISNLIPVKSGYTFMGWSISNDDIVTYKPGDIYTDNTSITLYAVWSAISYTILYNGNGATDNNPGIEYKQYGTDYQISNLIPVKSGYTFMGWSISNDNIATYQPGDMYTDNTSITLYAIWKINTYTNRINHLLRGFKNNDGNAESNTCYLMKSETFTNTYKLAINLNTDNALSDIPNGFILNNQFGHVNENDGIIYYNMGKTIYQEDSDMTFNFYYDPIDYSINYSLNGGNNNSNNPATYNILYGVTLAKANKPGSRFGNWTDNTNNVITGINEGKDATFTDTISLQNELATRTTGSITVNANWETLGSTTIPGIGTYQCFICHNEEWVLYAPHIVKDGVWEPY